MRTLCWGPDGTRWSARRLINHIAYLPRESAYVRVLLGDRAYWNESAALLAEAVDAIERQTYYQLKAGGNEPPVPTPFPRPGVKPAEPATVSLSDFVQSLGAADV